MQSDEIHNKDSHNEDNLIKQPLLIVQNVGLVLPDNMSSEGKKQNA